MGSPFATRGQGDKHRMTKCLRRRSRLFGCQIVTQHRYVKCFLPLACLAPSRTSGCCFTAISCILSPSDSNKLKVSEDDLWSYLKMWKEYKLHSKLWVDAFSSVQCCQRMTETADLPRRFSRQENGDEMNEFRMKISICQQVCVSDQVTLRNDFMVGGDDKELSTGGYRGEAWPKLGPHYGIDRGRGHSWTNQHWALVRCSPGYI